MKIKDKGIYILVLKLEKSQFISAGKLKRTKFQPGIYLYVGKAHNGLRGRLKRHLRTEKKIFWHIDYFLQKTRIEDIWVKRNSFEECQIVGMIREIRKDAIVPLKKFGSSDCNCPGHLLHLTQDKGDLQSLRKNISFEKVDIHGIQD